MTKLNKSHIQTIVNVTNNCEDVYYGYNEATKISNYIDTCDVYGLFSDNEIVSFIIIDTDYIEFIASIKAGYGSKLLTEITNKYQSLELHCNPDLMPYYKGNGFTQIFEDYEPDIMLQMKITK